MKTALAIGCLVVIGTIVTGMDSGAAHSLTLRRGVIGGTPAPHGDTAVIGTWRLHSITEPPTAEGEAYRWMGAKPTGLLVYAANGYVSVQIMRDPRPTFTGGSREIRGEDAIDALRGYYAYFGRYENAPGARYGFDSNVIVHHVEASLWPREVGLEYVRPFERVADTLVYRAMRADRQWRTTKWIRLQ